MCAPVGVSGQRLNNRPVQRLSRRQRSAAIAYRSVGGIPIICCAQRLRRRRAAHFCTERKLEESSSLDWELPQDT